MDVKRIKELLPQRYPILLLDRIDVIVPGERLKALKAVTVNEPWYQDLDPSAGYAYPSVLLIESFGQAAGVLALTDPTQQEDLPDDIVMLFGSVTDFRFHAPVFPGCVVEHDVRIMRGISNTMMFEGESRVDGKVILDVARGVMALRPAEVLPAPMSASASVPRP
jgi:3-hydroxyacyl-[acyl-carrier-protein] dehydratase